MNWQLGEAPPTQLWVLSRFAARTTFSSDHTVTVRMKNCFHSKHQTRFIVWHSSIKHSDPVYWYVFSRTCSGWRVTNVRAVYSSVYSDLEKHFSVHFHHDVFICLCIGKRNCGMIAVKFRLTKHINLWWHLEQTTTLNNRCCTAMLAFDTSTITA